MANKCGAKFDADNVIFIRVKEWLYQCVKIFGQSPESRVDVRYFAKNGINISSWDNAPIRYASRNGHIDIVRFFWQRLMLILIHVINGHIEVIRVVKTIRIKKLIHVVIMDMMKLVKEMRVMLFSK